MSNVFSAASIGWLEKTKYVKIRAGDSHRFIHVWIVLVDDRVFARSWSNKPTGWFAAFLKTPAGAIEIDGNAIPVAARLVKDDKTLDAVTTAFGRKYTTGPNQKYVAGFAEPARRQNTVELVPI